MGKHTPGPWKVSEGETWISVGPADDNQPLLADTIGWRPDGPKEPGPRGRDECRANARLMAAAPAFKLAWDMVPVEIQERILDALHKPDTAWVETAIAQAEGD